MYAERLMLETDVFGNLMSMPTLPPNKRLEAIFLVISEQEASSNIRRKPHAEIAGKSKIIGDIFDSVPTGSWDLVK